MNANMIEITIHQDSDRGTSWHHQGESVSCTELGETLPNISDKTLVRKGGDYGLYLETGCNPRHFWATFRASVSEALWAKYRTAAQARASEVAESLRRQLADLMATYTEGAGIGSPSHPERALNQLIQRCIETQRALPATLNEAAAMAVEPWVFDGETRRRGRFGWEIYADHQCSLARVVAWSRHANDPEGRAARVNADVSALEVAAKVAEDAAFGRPVWPGMVTEEWIVSTFDYLLSRDEWSKVSASHIGFGGACRQGWGSTSDFEALAKTLALARGLPVQLPEWEREAMSTGAAAARAAIQEHLLAV